MQFLLENTSTSYCIETETSKELRNTFCKRGAKGDVTFKFLTGALKVNLHIKNILTLLDIQLSLIGLMLKKKD